MSYKGSQGSDWGPVEIIKSKDLGGSEMFPNTFCMYEDPLGKVPDIPSNSIF